MLRLKAAALLFFALFLAPAPALAASDLLIPGIWVDPDGCEHWVMDDGWEGYMSPVVMPDGRPVCGRQTARANTCGLVPSQAFAENSATLSASAESGIRKFFRNGNAKRYDIVGHTDSRASAAYNMELSMRRAKAVARIAGEEGVRVNEVRAMGESMPRASNKTESGRAMNRRVEILCAG